MVLKVPFNIGFEIRSDVLLIQSTTPSDLETYIPGMNKTIKARKIAARSSLDIRHKFNSPYVPAGGYRKN